MYKCNDCINYKSNRQRECIVYNNEVNPQDDADYCCEFYKNKEINFETLTALKKAKESI